MILEKNIIKKKINKINIRFALTYPNIYKIAMSSLGYELLYNFINLRKDTYCERIIFPNTQSIETNSPLKDFNIISFTFQFEEDYLNFLKMLKMENIPLKRENRNNTHPLIIAGGPCVSSNPEPIADFIDLFIIGDGEAILNDLIDCYTVNKKNLEKYLNIKGIYIPKFKNKTEITLINNLDETYHLTTPIITESINKQDLPIFNKTIKLNVSRGCTRGCRFCMSGYLYRPIRETSIKKLLEIAETTRLNTGLNKIILIGTAVGDYSKLEILINELLKRGFEVSTPSLRIESINYNYLKTLRKSGVKTLTIAPESIYKLRKKINKDISDDKIFEVINDAKSLGFKIKYYFLIGFPEETMEDIIELSQFIKNINNKNMKFSINPIIPKAHTPLEYEQYNFKDIKNKMRFLKKELKNINIKYESPKKGLIQYILSCGDNTLSEILLKSLTKNITIKEWLEYIPNYKSSNEFPWKNINVGINETFLKIERKRMKNNKTTPWCNKNICSHCGSCKKKIKGG